MWKTPKENTNGTRKSLLFSLPFSDQTLSTSSKPPSVPSFQHSEQASRYHTGRSLSDFPPHLQAPTPPLRNPRFHPRCELAPSRRRLQPTNIGSTPDVMEIEQRRPQCCISLAAILPSLLFSSKSNFPFGSRGQV